MKSTTPTRRSGPNVDLDTIVARQRGLVTRRQILASGHVDNDVRRWIAHRAWQRVLPGIYAAFTGEPTLEQRRVAAYLFAGPASQMTGIAALKWHGLRYLPDDERIHMLVPHSDQRRSYGFAKIQRTRSLDGATRRENGYTVVSVARAVADASRSLNDLQSVRAVVAEAVQRKLTTVPALMIELERAGRHRTRLLRQALREVGGGAASAPEAQLLEAFARSGILPDILWNPLLESNDGQRLPSPDGWIDDVGIAIEVDSREYHLNPDGWERTLRRHNSLAESGALVLHFTPSDVRRSGRVVRITERAYLERLRHGAKASVRVISRPPP